MKQNVLDFADWQFVTEEGERAIFFAIESSPSDVSVEARSLLNMELYARVGENRVVLAGGTVIDCRMRLAADGLELVVYGPSSYRVSETALNYGTETDPRPVLSALEVTPVDNISQMVEDAVRARFAQLEHMQVLREEVDPQELLDDILNGDLEFDEEEDSFGQGYMDEEEPEERGPLGPITTNEPPQAREEPPGAVLPQVEAVSASGTSASVSST